MKTLTVTEVARNFRSVMDGVEFDQDEIILTRDQKPVARLVPEPASQSALEVFGDLYRTLDDATAKELAGTISSARRQKFGRLSELQDPWAS